LAIRAVVGSFRLHQAPGLSGSYSCMRRGARARGQSHTTACAPRGRPSGHSKSFCVSMSRYMTTMATRFFPRMAVAAIGPGPGWRRPPKTRNGSLGTFRSYLTFFSSMLHSIAKTMTTKAAVYYKSFHINTFKFCKTVIDWTATATWYALTTCHYAPQLPHGIPPQLSSAGGIEKSDIQDIRPYALCVAAITNSLTRILLG
jgi:hypothetical protein